MSFTHAEHWNQHAQLVEQRVADALAPFLEDHQVDLSYTEDANEETELFAGVLAQCVFVEVVMEDHIAWMYVYMTPDFWTDLHHESMPRPLKPTYKMMFPSAESAHRALFALITVTKD